MEFNATFIITAISFLIFVYLMKIILYRPLEQIVEQRSQLIANNYQDAQVSNEKANSLLVQRADKIAKAKLEAKKLLDEKIKEGYDESATMLDNAKSENNTYLEAQKANLISQSEQIKHSFREEELKLANLIKDKFLDKEVYHE